MNGFYSKSDFSPISLNDESRRLILKMLRGFYKLPKDVQVLLDDKAGVALDKKRHEQEKERALNIIADGLEPFLTAEEIKCFIHLNGDCS